MPERETKNFDLLVTKGAKGELESSIGFNYGELQVRQ